MSRPEPVTSVTLPSRRYGYAREKWSPLWEVSKVPRKFFVQVDNASFKEGCTFGCQTDGVSYSYNWGELPICMASSSTTTTIAMTYNGSESLRFGVFTVWFGQREKPASCVRKRSAVAPSKLWPDSEAESRMVRVQRFCRTSLLYICTVIFLDWSQYGAPGWTEACPGVDLR